MSTITKKAKTPFVEIKNGKIIKFQRGHNAAMAHFTIHCSKKIEYLNDWPNKKRPPLYSNPGNKRTTANIKMAEGETIKIYPLRGKKCQVVHYAGRNRVQIFKFTTWQRKSQLINPF